MSDAEQIATFLAARGATKIAEGAATRTKTDWRYAVRGEQRPVPKRAQREERPRMRCVTDHAGREFWFNEEGEVL